MEHPASANLTCPFFISAQDLYGDGQGRFNSSTFYIKKKGSSSPVAPAPTQLSLPAVPTSTQLTSLPTQGTSTPQPSSSATGEPASAVTANPSLANKLTIGLAAGLSLAFLIIIAGVVLIVLRRRKRRQATKVDPMTTPSQDIRDIRRSHKVHALSRPT